MCATRTGMALREMGRAADGGSDAVAAVANAGRYRGGPNASRSSRICDCSVDAVDDDDDDNEFCGGQSEWPTCAAAGGGVTDVARSAANASKR